ncbi:KdsC family phosphatase [Eisenbergiella tayi]|uniref:KdsC family phosphatase n=1 Tax=Eisenbergiella tayi TaxID=1432052 RepID=UPI0008496A14|nr:HAD-IIIA family hydrolase [Eisenbergiella tayi]ODR36036.1 hypothetical protein BEI60_15520 [Eisenbergiella tayi]
MQTRKIEYEKIKYLFLDVDGTLTDGGLYYGDNNIEIKKFNTKDGTGILAALEAGIEIVVLTGRESEAVKRRVKELGISYLIQNIRDKEKYVEEFIEKQNVTPDNIAYFGDDLNDYWAMRKVGYVLCPKDADYRVKEISDFVATLKGGYGAVREGIFDLLEKRKQLEDVLFRISHK